MNEINDSFFKINIFVLGNAGVGKTCFILKYINNDFQSNYLNTIGVDLMAKTITLPNDEKVKISFYDTAGEERYRSISFNLIKLADGILLMYDICDQQSFKAIPGWLESIRDAKGSNYPIILIGNKCDLMDKRIVQREEGENVAAKNELSFYESSNKEGINIDEPVMDLVSIIMKDLKKDKKINGNNDNKSIKINNKESKKHGKKKCCKN